MVVGAMGNTASTPQASCGHISIVRSILSASPCAVPVSSHMDWCLSTRASWTSPRRRRALESTCGRDMHAHCPRAKHIARRAPQKTAVVSVVVARIRCFIGWEAGDVHGPAFSSASRADAVRLAMQSTFATCWQLGRVWHISVSSCVSVSLERG